jgi:hypothetical protein
MKIEKAAETLGRQGGLAISKSKSLSSRINGSKGGRPLSIPFLNDDGGLVGCS